jgi:hypothetical protein
MTEVNYRRNGRRYQTRKPRYKRFWWATKPSGLYIGSGAAPAYCRAVKRRIRRRIRRK